MYGTCCKCLCEFENGFDHNCTWGVHLTDELCLEALSKKLDRLSIDFRVALARIDKPGSQETPQLRD